MSPRLFITLLWLTVLWGSAFPLIQVGLEGFSAANLTLLRFLIASASFVPYLLVTRQRLLPARADLPYFFLLGLLGITIYHLALNYGSLHVSAGAASLIIATAPAITAVVAFLMLGERLPLLGWLGIFTSFVGVAIIAIGDNPQPGFNPYALLVLISSVVTAFFVVLQKRMLAKYGAVAITAFATWAGTAPLLVFLPGLSADLATAGAGPIWAAIYIGLFPAAIAYALFAHALSQAPVTLVTAFLYGVPVFSLLFAWLLLGEVPGWLTLAGGALAISGIMIVNVAKRPHANPKGRSQKREVVSSRLSP